MNLLLGAWYALQQNFHNQKRAVGDTDQRGEETEYDDRQSMLPFVKVEQRLESFPQGKTDEQEDDTAPQRKLVDWTRRLAYTTGALAIATFIVACFSGWQAWEMRQGSADTARLALAARDQADVSKDTEERQLRAYVIAEFPNSLDNFVAGKKAESKVPAQNVGQTPVYDMGWIAGFSLAARAARESTGW